MMSDQGSKSSFTRYCLVLVELIFLGMSGLRFRDGLTESPAANASLICLWLIYSQRRIPHGIREVFEYGNRKSVPMRTARGISVVFTLAIIWATWVKPLLQ